MNQIITLFVVAMGLLLQSCTIINPMYVDNSLVMYQKLIVKRSNFVMTDEYAAYFLMISGTYDSCKYTFKNSGCENLSKDDEVVIEYLMLINQNEGRVYLLSAPGKSTPEMNFLDSEGLDLAGILEEGKPYHVTSRGDLQQSDEEFIAKIFDEITVQKE